MAEIQEGRHQRALQREFATRGAPTIAPELGGVIHPVVIVADTREPSGLGQEVEQAYSDGTTVQPAANPSVIGLQNPPGSTITMKLHRMYVATNGTQGAPTPFAWGLAQSVALGGAYASSQGSGWNMSLPPFGGRFGVGQMVFGNPAVPPFSTFFVGDNPGWNPNILEVVFDHGGIVITPGFMLAIETFSSASLYATFHWTERPTNLT